MDANSGRAGAITRHYIVAQVLHQKSDTKSRAALGSMRGHRLPEGRAGNVEVQPQGILCKVLQEFASRDGAGRMLGAGR